MVIGYSLLVYGILSILLAAESRSHGKTQLIVISYWLLVIRYWLLVGFSFTDLYLTRNLQFSIVKKKRVLLL